MRRTFLVSFLVIGAALAVLFGGGTFSAFNDVENISGSASAAILDFELSGDGVTTGVNEAAGVETLTPVVFDNAGVSCAFPGAGTYYAPGDTCTIQVALTRDPLTIAQQLAADLTETGFSVTATVPNGSSTDLNAAANIIALDCDSGAAGGDADAEWTITYNFVDTDGSATHMPAQVPDTNQRIDVTVALDINAGNGCQNSSLTAIAIQITATQSAAPHSTTD